MSDKIGRNSPCSCGSGKKHKKCCLSKVVSTSKDVSSCRNKKLDRLLSLERDVHQKYLFPYVSEILEAHDFRFSCAYDDFLLDNKLNEPQDERHNNLFKERLFMPWLIFNWAPCDHLKNVPGFNCNDTIAINCLNVFGDRLRSEEKRYIEQMSQTYYSFYCVQKVTTGESLVLKDVLLEKTYTVQANDPTKVLKPGDVFFGRILSMGSDHFLVSMSSFVFLPEWQTRLIDLRLLLKESNDGMPILEELLRDLFEVQVRMVFFVLMRERFCEKKHVLHNTDNELFVLTKSFFTLDMAPEAALHRLMPLTLSDDPEVFLEGAQRDEAGDFVRIKVDWMVKGNKQHKSWENTILGYMTLEPGQLTLETNSEERAERGQKLIKNLLGDAISLENVTKDKVEDLLEARQASLEDDEDEDEDDNDEAWQNSPEAKAQMAQMAKAYWESWFDEEIPMLGDKTPKEAAKTKIGREKLEALFLQYAQYDERRKPNDPFKTNIQYLRETLGIE